MFFVVNMELPLVVRKTYSMLLMQKIILMKHSRYIVIVMMRKLVRFTHSRADTKYRTHKNTDTHRDKN